MEDPTGSALGAGMGAFGALGGSGEQLTGALGALLSPITAVFGRKSAGSQWNAPSLNLEELMIGAMRPKSNWYD